MSHWAFFTNFCLIEIDVSGNTVLGSFILSKTRQIDHFWAFFNELLQM